MSNERHARLSRLYLQARELDTGPRERFIAEQCAEETTLGNELRAMLRHSADPPDILRTGAVAGALVSEPEPIPESIGPYEVIDRLGEGGMGVVYRARQRQPIERQVAVKLIKSGIETRQAIQRFQSERQALARLSHPNIVRVFDAGDTADGRIYFAMEYVHGVPITQYCDAERMSIGARIELFLIVCRAVQHAHHNAIIHRDLKSSNILVTVDDGEPFPKIIDFGVSKTLSATPGGTGVTRLGQMIGTLEHMSPEQTESDSRNVDTRTDVYALGILLYELMVGTLPFVEHGGTLDLVDAIRRIREEDPPSPSDLVRRVGRSAEQAAANRNTDLRGLRRQLRGDIDTIVAKCLEKDRDRRYGSPAELADDLGRHLAHEPISAGRPGFAYRTVKLIRKHRTAFAVALVLGIGAAAFAYVAIRDSARIAEQQRRADYEAEQAADILDLVISFSPASIRFQG